ncbi:Hypothetical predicted protein [Podarcis lilfordi]|uniref:Uncharacterized protein n=1 Tax=Podarcis lilfordi TaxID=74358 RepID=A0AA35NZ31_9SAUR|nr:Hypothetical predicted protein [Podarcis lilfordi]
MWFVLFDQNLILIKLQRLLDKYELDKLHLGTSVLFVDLQPKHFVLKFPCHEDPKSSLKCGFVRICANSSESSSVSLKRCVCVFENVVKNKVYWHCTAVLSGAACLAAPR